LGDSSIAKRKIEKVAALIAYYEDLKSRGISSEYDLDDVRSKLLFTQKEILKLCLESKKTIKDLKEKRATF